jgi:ABC-type transport system involved in multi-copper enzyme maturation permease subunit
VKQLLAIARRETGTFFHSAMAPVVLAGFLILVGLFFTLFVFGYCELSHAALKDGRTTGSLNLAEGVFQPLIADMAIFLLFLLPAITMRLFAEEYRSGRYVLVMSYPVPDHIWVLGKFTSVLVVAAVLILAATVYFVFASWLGHPEPGPLLAAAIGLLLLASVIGAWGVFFSSLFPYQLVSYFLTFAFVLLLYIIDGLAPHLPGTLSQITHQLSLRVHFSRFSWGVVDLRDVVFFLAWALVGLSAAGASLAGKRLLSEQRLLRWLPTGVLALLLLSLYLVVLHYPLSSDWTRNKRYSLAPQTIQVLQTLDRDVTVHAFYQRLDPQRKALEVLLRACRDRSPHFHFELVDPDRELALVERYGVSSPRTVVIESGEKRKVLLEPDESPLINAVYRLVTGTRPVLYYLLGHGEHRLDSNERGGYAIFNQVLTDQGYAVRPLLLAATPEVPADADILVVSAPKLELGAAEVKAIQEFVRAGGAVLALVDPGIPESVAAWLSSYNVAVGNDFIVSVGQSRREYGVDARVVVVHDADGYAEHDATRGLPGQATFFPFTQSLRPLHAGRRGVATKWILRSGLHSWAEQDLKTIAAGKPEYDENEDQPGPVVFGIALEVNRSDFFSEDGTSATTGPWAEAPELPDDPVLRSLQAFQAQSPPPPPSIFNQEATSRLIVIGDSEFAANANINLYGNRDLLLNVCGWLARERVLIERRAVERISRPVILTTGQKEALGWGSILGWPLLLAAASSVVVVRHRHRR